jgi:hypothetical protein
MAQLARDRKYRHETVDRETFLVCAARLLKVRTDLSGVTIRRWANNAHIVLDQHDLVIVDGVRNNPDDPFLDHETLGRMLRLTTDERDRIDFRNAWPFDVPREDTKARRAAKKREADRARNEQKRRAADKQPRAEYLANANAAKARALGVSRATYYRNRLHETGPSHHDETGVSRHDGETCGYRHDETGPSPTSKRRKKEGAATNLLTPRDTRPPNLALPFGRRKPRQEGRGYPGERLKVPSNRKLTVLDPGNPARQVESGLSRVSSRCLPLRNPTAFILVVLLRAAT